MRERIECFIAYSLIIFIAAVVLTACFLLWPIQVLIDKSSEKEKKDKRLRDSARLIMLKSGRL